MKLKVWEILIAILLGLGIVFYFYNLISHVQPMPIVIPQTPVMLMQQSTTTETFTPEATPTFPFIKSSIIELSDDIVSKSPGSFDYAHGTVAADNKFFVGMEDRGKGVIATDHIAAFMDPAHLDRYVLVALPVRGSVETMVFDSQNDKVYFLVSGTHGLNLYSLDPHTLGVDTIASTTQIDAGDRPAIVTDGTYVYGITNTDPAIVFKVALKDGTLITNKEGHIPFGHSAALVNNGDFAELYFGGNRNNKFEKVRADDLSEEATVDLGPCALTDDIATQSDSENTYLYIGCEMTPFGFRIHTPDMQVSKFQLPGSSLGFFNYRGELFNAARDGMIDAFPNYDVSSLHRLRITDPLKTLGTTTPTIEINELFYSTTTDSLYFTAWWGVPGIYQLSTTTFQ